MIDEKPKLLPTYTINRRVLTQQAVIEETSYETSYKTIPAVLKDYCKSVSCLKLFRGLFPILEWLPNYSFKNNLLGDLISGITVSVMQIPQGMAYGMLAGVQAKVGLYMAFFQVLVYMIFGTSRHISIGTFAVISLMTRKVVQTYSRTEIITSNMNSSYDGITNGNYISEQEIYTPIQVVTALAIATSILHLAMALLRLGKLSSLLTDPLVNGFTTAAAFHVASSQLKNIFGIKIPRFKGAFKIIYTLIYIGENIKETNLATLILSTCVITFMIIMNEIVHPSLSKICRFPLPVEFIAVLGGTLITRYSELEENYNIVIIGKIPVGLPEPFFPPLSLINKLWLHALPIAIVSFSVVISMGLLLAKKHAYEIKANQELIALGVGNLISGCFSCMPMCCSLSRSLIQEQTGGVTQISSFVAAMLILLILLVIGPFFETLPRCVLAGVIIFALKGMFMQFKEVKTFAKQGNMELFIWLVTFFSVVIIDYDIGLAIGIVVAIGAFFLKSVKPYYCLMGTLPSSETGVYVCLDRHKNAIEISGIKIFHYAGSVNFATMAGYKKCLCKAINVNSTQIRKPSLLDPNEVDKFLPSFQTLILDLSAVAHIDVAGCHVITEILKEMDMIGVKLFLAAPSDRVYDTLIHSMSLGEGPFVILPTIHDAVLLGSAYHYKSQEKNQKEILLANYTINRRILTQDVLNQQTNYEPYQRNFKESIKCYYNNFNFLYEFKNFFPILKWLPKYSIRKTLVKDTLSGFTVSILQILQGIAYGLLAGVPPIVGLYSTFFPVLVYVIFGTSHHVSIGPLAVVSLMTRDIIAKHSQDGNYFYSKIYSNSTIQKCFKNLSTPANQNLKFNENIQAPIYSNMEIAAALAVATSIVQFALAILRVGRFSTFLCDPFVKAFTTAIAFHIIVSQLDDMFGIKIVKRTTFLSNFKIFYKIVCVAEKLSETNIVTLIITISVLIFMLTSLEVIYPYLLKFFPYLIPAELIVIVVYTLIFSYTSLAHDYNINVVGEIPTGLPKPEFPPLSLINNLWVEAIELAFVIVVLTISMGILFGERHSYNIEPNQEIYALAFANFVGGCFSCMPSASSVSRSLIQEQTGGVTQIASFVAAMCNLLVLLHFGPIFEVLPKCILAAMVVVSLKSMFMQIKQVKIFAKQGRMELAMWSFTFFTSLIFNYVWGLIVGVLTVVIVFFMRSLKSYHCILGTSPVVNTGIYVCMEHHKTAVEVPNVKIFYYAGSVNFVTMYHFKKCFLEAININKSDTSRSSLQKLNFSTVILDLSAVVHLDASSCQILTEILKELNLLGLNFFLASPSHNVYDTLFHSVSLGEGPFVILPTVHDAVLLAESYHKT